MDGGVSGELFGHPAQPAPAAGAPYVRHPRARQAQAWARVFVAARGAAKAQAYREMVAALLAATRTPGVRDA